MIYIVKKHEPKELKEYRESESSTGVRPTYDSRVATCMSMFCQSWWKNREDCAHTVCAEFPKPTKKQEVH